MEKNRSCITNCYSVKNQTNPILHPFVSVIALREDKKNQGVCGSNYNKLFTQACSASTPVVNNVTDSIKNPINIEDYLSVYFGLNTMEDIIKYINDNIDMSVNMKSRILDFAFISYKDDIENEPLQWITFIKTLFNDTSITDDMIIKILKKIIKKYDLDIKNYPFNLLLKIKKFLDYNI